MAQRLANNWETFASVGVPYDKAASGSKPWILFNATGFVTMRGSEPGRAAQIGDSHWNIISLSGSTSVENFDVEQYTFVCNWLGLMGPELPQSRSLRKFVKKVST